MLDEDGSPRADAHVAATTAILAAPWWGSVQWREELTGHGGSGREKNSVYAERCLLGGTTHQRPTLVSALVVTGAIGVPGSSLWFAGRGAVGQG